MQNPRLTLLIVLLGISSHLAGAQEGPASDAEFLLDSHIGHADPTQYKAVCDARDWRNPLLDVTTDGFVVQSASVPTPKFVAVSDLGRVLTELPATDWPYGRAVAIPSWRAIKADLDKAAMMNGALKLLLRLRADWWVWPHECEGPSTRQSPR